MWEIFPETSMYFLQVPTLPHPSQNPSPTFSKNKAPPYPYSPKKSVVPPTWDPHSCLRLTELVRLLQKWLGDLPLCRNGDQIQFLRCQIWQIQHVGLSEGNVSADKTSVVSADKTSVVSADKTSVVSADKTSVVSQDIPMVLRRRPQRRRIGNGIGMPWETTDVLSVDTTDV